MAKELEHALTLAQAERDAMEKAARRNDFARVEKHQHTLRHQKLALTWRQVLAEPSQIIQAVAQTGSVQAEVRRVLALARSKHLAMTQAATANQFMKAMEHHQTLADQMMVFTWQQLAGDPPTPKPEVLHPPLARSGLASQTPAMFFDPVIDVNTGAFYLNWFPHEKSNIDWMRHFLAFGSRLLPFLDRISPAVHPCPPWTKPSDPHQIFKRLKYLKNHVVHRLHAGVPAGVTLDTQFLLRARNSLQHYNDVVADDTMTHNRATVLKVISKMSAWLKVAGQLHPRFLVGKRIYESRSSVFRKRIKHIQDALQSGALQVQLSCFQDFPVPLDKAVQLLEKYAESHPRSRSSVEKVIAQLQGAHTAWAPAAPTPPSRPEMTSQPTGRSLFLQSIGLRHRRDEILHVTGATSKQDLLYRTTRGQLERLGLDRAETKRFFDAKAIDYNSNS